MATFLSNLPVTSDLSSFLWWFLVAWMFAVMSCIGSFLNVVVYRMPLGKSISKPRSFCPNCMHPIRGYHNIPILAWIFLRGRCYDCGVKIPFRYPLVEFIVAIAATLLLVRGPLNPAIGPGLTEIEVAVLWAEFFVAVLAFCVLFAAALIHFDRLRIPLSIMVPASLVVIVVRLLMNMNFETGLFQLSNLPAFLESLPLTKLTLRQQTLMDGLVPIAVITALHLFQKKISFSQPDSLHNLRWLILFSSLASSWAIMLGCFIGGALLSSIFHFASKNNFGRKNSVFGLSLVLLLTLVYTSGWFHKFPTKILPPQIDKLQGNHE